MQAQLAFLRKAKWVDEASAELAERDPDLATSLRLALSESGAQGSSGGHAAATHVIDTLWRRVEDGAGWTEPFWRETYVLACVAAATHSADDVAALRHLDTAFIMGGPAEVLQPFVALVEPGALAAAVARRAVTAVAGAPPPCEPSLPCLSNELPRLNNPSAKEFLAFYRADRPVVMTGLTEDWEGRRSWGDLNWWSETHGHRFVPLECGAFNDAAWHEEVASIRDFVVRMREEIVYLAQHTLFEQLPSLCDDFQVPECLRGKVTRTNAWIGSQNTVTPLHFDSYDGVLCQVVGYKHVRLYAPSETPKLYRSRAAWTSQRRWPSAEAEGDGPEGEAAQGTISLVDVERPDHARFPLFKQAQCLETVLHPGDCLFIPARVWHWVKSLSQSASISFVL